MPRFDACLALILRFEGGYSNDPADPGGATNLGITQKELSAYCYAHGFPAMDVRDLSAYRASQIYQAGYWAPCHCDYLPPGLDVVMFDSAVNCGVGRAIGWMQGVMGIPVTEMFDAAASQAYHVYVELHGSQSLAAGVLARRVAYYHEIGDNGPLHKFEAGWENRVSELASFAGLPEPSGLGV